MDIHAANRIWLPTQPRVCNLINFYIRSHLYTTAETTNYNNPPNMKTDEHITPQIPYIHENNIAHCYRTTPHEKRNTTESSAPEDGDRVARNMLSNL